MSRPLINLSWLTNACVPWFRHLEDCRCTIKPRSLSAEALIRNWEADAPYDVDTEMPV